MHRKFVLDLPFAGSVRVISALLLLAVLPGQQARAGDEEFNPSIYQVFDPETGYFIDVEPGQEATAQGGSVPADPAATDAIAATNTVTAVPDTTAPASASSLNPVMITAGAIALVLVAGFAVRKRKDEH